MLSSCFELWLLINKTKTMYSIFFSIFGISISENFCFYKQKPKKLRGAMFEIKTNRLWKWQHKSIQILECAIPPPAPASPPPPRHKKSGSLLLLLYFSKNGQLDMFKAPDSISDHQTLIFPEHFWMFWFFLRGSHGLSAHQETWRASSQKLGPGGPLDF